MKMEQLEQLNQIENFEVLLILGGLLLLGLVFKAMAAKQDYEDSARQKEFNQSLSKIPKHVPMQNHHPKPKQSQHQTPKPKQQFQQSVSQNQTKKGNASNLKDLKSLLEDDGNEELQKLLKSSGLDKFMKK